MKKKVMRFFGNPWGQRLSLLIIIVIVMLVFERKFFQLGNISSILRAIAIYGVMVCGMLFPVLIGGMDLSVGSMAGLSASITFLIAERSGFSTGGFFSGLAVALLVCLIVGYLHGCFVTHFGLPAFVVTLATKNIIYGCIQLVTGGYFTYITGKGIAFQLGNSRPLGIPMPVIILVVCIAISAFVLGKTTYGRRLYAIGGNARVSVLVGINSFLNTKIAYMISSAAAGFAGVILASSNGQAGQTTASGYEGSVLMAMVVGGINLAGGEGGIPGAIFGALLVGIINNMMLLLDVSSDFQKFVQGIVILAAISLNVITKRRSASAPKKRHAKTSA